MTRRLAIIGTAGRDRTKSMDRALWEAMLADARARVQPGDELVSGGAAWADHLAVQLFLEGAAARLTLFLPAPLFKAHGPDGRWLFEEAGGKSAGSAANFYHRRFSTELGVDTLAQLVQAAAAGAVVHAEPVRPGFAAMFARNAKVASHCSAVLAYTFAAGDLPADGGTRNTWEQVDSPDRTHVDLGALQAECARPTPAQATHQALPSSRAARYRG